MVVRACTLGGLGALAAAGPLLAVAVQPSWGLIGVLGVLAMWLGIGATLTALVLVARSNHHLIRRTAQRVAELAVPAASADAIDRAALDDALRGLRETLSTQQQTDRDAVLATLDARILGLHATVREALGADRADRS
jgi:hypothetical protein